jgi:hypothetical protein
LPPENLFFHAHFACKMEKVVYMEKVVHSFYHPLKCSAFEIHSAPPSAATGPVEIHAFSNWNYM